MENAQPIQLVNYNKQEKIYTLNEKALQRIIEENEVQDLPVSVISVGGEFRKGKSFLLNFFLRYLYSEDRENWLNDSSESLEGFPWRSGRERETVGIHVWSKIFKLPTADGSQVAVILMDTQGTFDGNSSNKTGDILLALSALVSSIQIYNLSQQINENDLENLLLVTAYASFGQEETKQTPFQTLRFLVRDWQNYEEIPYGEEGGKKYLDERLQSPPDQEPSLVKVRKTLRSSFEKLSCCLLPHPGRTVSSNKDFKGAMKDIDKEFITHIRTFIPSVLSPNNLVVKNMNGIELKGSQFVELFATYLKHYNSDGLPDEVSKTDAFVEAYCVPMKKRSVNIYKTGMVKMLDVDRIEDCTSYVFSEAHKHMQTMAQSEFNKEKRVKKDNASRFSAMLTEEIDGVFQKLNLRRRRMYEAHAKDHYDALVKEVVKNYDKEMAAELAKAGDFILEVRLDRYSPTGFRRIHEKYRKVAIDTFGEGKRFGDYDATECLENMTTGIADSFVRYDRMRQSKFRSAAHKYYDRLLETCRTKYDSKIGQLKNGTQQAMTSNLHETYKSEAMNHFNEANCYSKARQSKYLGKLQTCIEKSYNLYQQDLTKEEKRQKKKEHEDKINEDSRKDQEETIQSLNEEIRKLNIRNATQIAAWQKKEDANQEKILDLTQELEKLKKLQTSTEWWKGFF